MTHFDQRTIAVAVSIGTSLFVALACAMVAIFGERKKDNDE